MGSEIRGRFGNLPENGHADDRPPQMELGQVAIEKSVQRLHGKSQHIVYATILGIWRNEDSFFDGI